VGLCTDSGQLLGIIGIEGPGRLIRRQPPPELARAVSEACATLGSEERTERMAGSGNFRGALAVVRTEREDVRAWALALIGTPPEFGPAWRFPVVILAVTTAALIVVCLNALWVLQRGIGQLRTSLRSLERDLGSKVELPRASELAAVGDGIVSLAQHLAQARQRERVLERSMESDRRLSALGRITAGVAHEVRNPLAALKLRLQLLRGKPGHFEGEPDIDAAITEVDRVDAVVRSLLTMAKGQALDPRPLQLGPWVDARLPRYGSEAEARGLRLIRQGDALGLADPAALERVLQNRSTMRWRRLRRPRWCRCAWTKKASTPA
jgi:signal transduction histidine kinase